MTKIKITVLKRVDPSVIFGGDVPDWPGRDGKYTVCASFEEGQEFVAVRGRKPEGFCSHAWRDISLDLQVLYRGGNFDGWMKKGEMITCCTDGVRPVSFKLERIED